jgi:hypothetical protein
MLVKRSESFQKAALAICEKMSNGQHIGGSSNLLNTPPILNVRNSTLV